jgi:G3E family GTPase
MQDPNAGHRRDIRTPVTILTGFLGSGKTTLLNRVLKDPMAARTAVVINEFGEVGIDHALTTASDDTIVVLENGCLCCTVFGDLVQTLYRLYHAREAGEIAFDQVVIETSGLAEAAPILQAFLSEPTLEGLYRVASIIGVIDAVNGAQTLANHAVSVRQLALADCILISKLDLAPERERATLRRTLEASLRQLNRGAPIYAVEDPALDPIRLIRSRAADPTQGAAAVEAWLGLADTGAAQAGDTDHADHHHEASVSSFSLVREEPLPREALTLLLSSLERYLGPSLLRVKGLVQVAEEPDRPAVIQGAQHLLHNLTWLERWPDDDHRTRIVFITQDVPAGDLEEMVNLLDRVARRTAAARLRASSATTAAN